VTRRGDEVDAEALAVVHRARQAADLDLAAVAGAGIDFPREGPAEEPARPRLHQSHQLHDLAVAGLQGLGGEADLQDLGEQ
jgi:hypothetical protein